MKKPVDYNPQALIELIVRGTLSDLRMLRSEALVQIAEHLAAQPHRDTVSVTNQVLLGQLRELRSPLAKSRGVHDRIENGLIELVKRRIEGR